MKYFEKNPDTFTQIYENFIRSQDIQEYPEKFNLISLTTKLLEEFGLRDYVKVLNLEKDSYENMKISRDLINALGNYSLAVNRGVRVYTREGIENIRLPKHSREAFWLFGNATMINNDVVYFKPIRIVPIIDMKEQPPICIVNKNIPRDVWMLVEHLKRTPEVLEHPEMYLGFSLKVQQNALDILEGLAHVWRRDMREYYKPNDEIIWKEVIIPYWNYFYTSTPQAGNISQRLTVFPWYNSSLLREMIADENDRIIALRLFWHIPWYIGNLEYGRTGFKVGPDYYWGIEGMKYFIQNMPKLYEEVLKSYPNGTYMPYTRAWIAEYRDIYHDWIGDRGDHGLREAMRQWYGGLGPEEFKTIIIPRSAEKTEPIPLYRTDKYLLANYDAGIEGYLSRNYSYWDLIKFIHGYGIEYGGWDKETRLIYYPIAFKAFGIVYYPAVQYDHYINAPAGYATGKNGAFFGLPDSLLKPLREGRYGRVYILPGNGISPITSPLDGILKDYEYGKQNPVEPNFKSIAVDIPGLDVQTIEVFRIGKRD
ncbi:MAG: hypothetical protein RMI56_02200 [Sulfolobales archaeon]|nr:hypothetical protein [Sulfolobales archaeon]MDW8082588.1 hypothetical protein [Sulfolobales archaeon]